MTKILVTNIQRFSLHDGPGIRTTVFLKGCSLRCPWCSNPENLESYPQPYIKDGIQGIYGKYISPEELICECLKDKAFYEGKVSDLESGSVVTTAELEKLPGGVTFSGGEALLQMPAILPVCQALHSFGVHIAVETCLFVPGSYLELAINHIDFFYVDMKILDPERCKSIEHGDIGLYLENLNRLLIWRDRNGHPKPVVIRVPIIGGYTDGRDNCTKVKKLIEKYHDNILKIELIQEHNLGASKYKSLGMTMDYHGVENALMMWYKSELSDLGILIEICKV